METRDGTVDEDAGNGSTPDPICALCGAPVGAGQGEYRLRRGDATHVQHLDGRDCQVRS